MKIENRKPKFTYNELVKIYKMNKESSDYKKYKASYHKWFKGLITEQQLHNILG